MRRPPQATSWMNTGVISAVPTPWLNGGARPGPGTLGAPIESALQRAQPLVSGMAFGALGGSIPTDPTNVFADVPFEVVQPLPSQDPFAARTNIPGWIRKPVPPYS